MIGEIGNFKMKKLLLILLCLPMIGFGQELRHKVKVYKASLNGSRIIINYDIIASRGDRNYEVKINVFKNGGVTPLKGLSSFNGDIGRDISSGSGKSIKWSILNDYPEINEDDKFAFEIITELQKLTIYDSDPSNIDEPGYSIAFLSAVAPGIADYKVFEKKKPYWIKTLVFYSGIIGGIWMNSASSSNYEKYNVATELDEIESYYSKSNNMKKWSNYCFIISGTIMLEDFTRVLLNRRENRKQYNLNK